MLGRPLILKDNFDKKYDEAISIDCMSTKIYDDCLSFLEDQDNYYLNLYVSDVGYYIRKNTQLNQLVENYKSNVSNFIIPYNVIYSYLSLKKDKIKKVIKFGITIKKLSKEISFEIKSTYVKITNQYEQDHDLESVYPNVNNMFEPLQDKYKLELLNQKKLHLNVIIRIFSLEITNFFKKNKIQGYYYAKGVYNINEIGKINISSPIRKFTDFVNLRQLKHYIRTKQSYYTKTQLNNFLKLKNLQRVELDIENLDENIKFKLHTRQKLTKPELIYYLLNLSNNYDYNIYLLSRLTPTSAIDLVSAMIDSYFKNIILNYSVIQESNNYLIRIECLFRKSNLYDINKKYSTKTIGYSNNYYTALGIACYDFIKSLITKSLVTNIQLPKEKNLKIVINQVTELTPDNFYGVITNLKQSYLSKDIITYLSSFPEFKILSFKKNKISCLIFGLIYNFNNPEISINFDNLLENILKIY